MLTLPSAPFDPSIPCAVLCSFCFFAHSVNELRTPTLRPGDVCPEALAAAASTAAAQQQAPSNQGMQASGTQLPSSGVQLSRSSQMQQQQLGSPRQLGEVRRWPASSSSMHLGDTGGSTISLGSSGMVEPSLPGGALPPASALGQQPAIPGGPQQPTAEAASRLYAKAIASRDAQHAQVPGVAFMLAVCALGKGRVVAST